MDYRLLSDRVLIKMDTPEEKTAAGIILPGENDEPPRTGEIVAIGTDCTILEKALRDIGKTLSDAPGMRVMMSTPFGGRVKVDGEDLHMFTEVDIALVYA